MTTVVVGGHVAYNQASTVGFGLARLHTCGSYSTCRDCDAPMEMERNGLTLSFIIEVLGRGGMDAPIEPEQ